MTVSTIISIVSNILVTTIALITMFVYIKKSNKKHAERMNEYYEERIRMKKNYLIFNNSMEIKYHANDYAHKPFSFYYDTLKVLEGAFTDYSGLLSITYYCAEQVFEFKTENATYKCKVVD